MNTMLEAAGEEHAATNLILTNPDVLADYVNEFGPNGPYPTRPPRKQLLGNRPKRVPSSKLKSGSEQNVVPRQFQRPEMDMPTPSRQQNQSGDFWGNFNEMMDSLLRTLGSTSPSSPRCPAS